MQNNLNNKVLGHRWCRGSRIGFFSRSKKKSVIAENVMKNRQQTYCLWKLKPRKRKKIDYITECKSPH